MLHLSDQSRQAGRQAAVDSQRRSPARWGLRREPVVLMASFFFRSFFVEFGSCVHGRWRIGFLRLESGCFNWFVILRC